MHVAFRTQGGLGGIDWRVHSDGQSVYQAAPHVRAHQLSAEEQAEIAVLIQAAWSTPVAPVPVRPVVLDAAQTTLRITDANGQTRTWKLSNADTSPEACWHLIYRLGALLS